MSLVIEYSNTAETSRKLLEGVGGAIYVADAISLVGNSQATLSVSGSAAQTAAGLDAGLYDVWCDETDVYVKLALTANDVTTSTGYPIKTGNTVNIEVPSGGYKLGGITAGAAGTLRYHRVR